MSRCHGGAIWDVSELLCGGEGRGLLPCRPFVEYNTTAINIVYVDEETEGHPFETINLMQNSNSLRVYYELFEYIADSVEERLAEETISSLLELYAWIIAVVKCVVVLETRGGHCQKLYADTSEANL